VNQLGLANNRKKRGTLSSREKRFTRKEELTALYLFNEGWNMTLSLGGGRGEPESP